MICMLIVSIPKNKKTIVLCVGVIRDIWLFSVPLSAAWQHKQFLNNCEGPSHPYKGERGMCTFRS